MNNNQLRITYKTESGINEPLDQKLKELLAEFNYTETGSTTNLETGERWLDFVEE